MGRLLPGAASVRTTARAFGPNAGRPIEVSCGERASRVLLTESLAVFLYFVGQSHSEGVRHGRREGIY